MGPTDLPSQQATAHWEAAGGATPQQRAGSSEWPWRHGGREQSADQPLPSVPSLREEPNRQSWVAESCADRAGVTRDSGGLGLAQPPSGGLSSRSLQAPLVTAPCPTEVTTAEDDSGLRC